MGDNVPDLKVISAGRLLDGKSNDVILDVAVLLEGSKICWVGPEKDLHIPEGRSCQTYGYPGKTILPGLVDVHTHMNLPGDGTIVEQTAAETDEMLLLRSVMNGRNHFEAGVTTARENGAKNQTAFALKDGINRGLIPGPRMVVCGRPITISGGHCWFFGGEVDGVVGVRSAVRQLVKEGADYIKLMATGGGTRTSFSHLPAFTLEELRAVTDEAHSFGKFVAMHATATQGIINALDAGADMLVHSNFYDPDGSYRFAPAVAERIAREEVWVNPTLHVGRSRIWRGDKLEEQGMLTQYEREALSATKEDYERRRKGCQQLIEFGCKVVAGSDGGWGVYPLGQFQWEIDALAEAGMPNRDCISVATSKAAMSIGMDHLVGSIEIGKEADLIVVEGDPLQDIRALRDVVAVFKGGIQHK